MTQSRENFNFKNFPPEIIARINSFNSFFKQTSYFQLTKFFKQYEQFADILLVNKNEKVKELLLNEFIQHLMKQLGIVLDVHINPSIGYGNPRRFVKAILLLDKLCWEIFCDNDSQKNLIKFEKQYPQENPVIPLLLYRYKQILFPNSIENSDAEKLKTAWKQGNRSALFAYCAMQQDDVISESLNYHQQKAKIYLAKHCEIDLNSEELQFFVTAFSYHLHQAVFLCKFFIENERKEYNALFNKFTNESNDNVKLNAEVIKKIKNLLANLVLEVDPIKTYKAYINSLLPASFQIEELPSIQLFKFNTVALDDSSRYIKIFFESIDSGWEANFKYSLMLPKIEERKNIVDKIKCELTNEQIIFLSEITTNERNLAADIFLNWSQNKITNFFTLLAIYGQANSRENKNNKSLIFVSYRFHDIEISKSDFFNFYQFILKLKLHFLNHDNKSAWQKIFEIIPINFLLNRSSESETLQTLFTLDISKIEKIEAFLNQLKPKIRNKLFNFCNYKFDIIVYFESLLFNYHYNAKEELKLKVQDIHKMTDNKAALMWKMRHAISSWDVEALFYFFGILKSTNHKSVLYSNVEKFLNCFNRIIVESLEQSRFLVELLVNPSYSRVNSYAALFLMKDLGIPIVKKLSEIEINHQSSLLELLCGYPPEITVARIKQGDLQPLFKELITNDLSTSFLELLPQDIINQIILYNYYLEKPIEKKQGIKRNYPECTDNSSESKRFKMTSEVNSVANNVNTCFYHSVHKSDPVSVESNLLQKTIISAQQLLTNAENKTDAEKIYLLHTLQKLISETIIENTNSKVSAANHTITFKK